MLSLCNDKKWMECLYGQEKVLQSMTPVSFYAWLEVQHEYQPLSVKIENEGSKEGT
jgi:hypothetical protein